ncbi:hypothetical protein Q3G72_034664 [Acer saccharum]|nr:hypothetical protein Q3G72_034664 [Acer saccharum]
MGCVQAKSSNKSPPGGLDKLKMESGYVGRGGMGGPRRSTGQRFERRESGRVQQPEVAMNYNVVYGNGSDGQRGGSSGGSGGGVDGDIVDGWPKWLTDNIPREVLAGLVPKSAEAYDKLDKVGQEMFAGRPIMPGRTEVEQLHRIFKLCGSPPEDYWKKLKLSTTFRPPHYKPRLFEVFGDFAESSLGLLSTLLALDPANRGSAYLALQNEFFRTNPLPCDLSGLPVIHNKDDDEVIETNEQRKSRRSKMKKRSQTLRERRSKDQATELSKEEIVFNKEELEKGVRLNVHGQDPSSSASSASSGSKPNQKSESPPFLLSPVAGMKNRPPLPTSKTRGTDYDNDNGNMYRINQINRSASTRDFRRLNQRKLSD